MPIFKLRRSTSGGGGGNKACPVDVSAYPGADLGAKLQAAINAMPATGGVLTCECLTGAQTISSTVTVNKPVEIIFGACVITCTAGPAILIQWAAGAGDASGSLVRGAGKDVTVFQAAGGVTPILRIDAYDISVRDMGVAYTSSDAGNVCIQIQPNAANPDDNVLRPHLENINITGVSRSGSGITFRKCYVAEVRGCFVSIFDNGVRFIDDGDWISSNAVMLCGGSRFWGNNYGINYENTGANFINQCVIEGNHIFAIKAAKGLMLTVVDTYFEQIAADGASGNVQIVGVADAFSRTYDFVGCVFLSTTGVGTDIVLGAGTFQQIQVFRGQLNSGVTVGAGQPVAMIDAENFGTNVGRTIQQSYASTAWTTTGNANISWQVQSFSDLTLLMKEQILVTSLETAAVGVSPFDSTIMMNPAADSAANFFGGRAVATTQAGNAKNFTGAIIGWQAGATHQGTGTVTLAESINVQMTNSSTGVIATGVGVLVAPVVNSGGGSITSYTSVQIQRSTAAVANRSLVTDGGLVVFNDGNFADGNFNVKSTGSNNMFWVRSADNLVGVGLLPAPGNGQFTSLRSSTEVAGTTTAIEADNISNPAAANTGNVNGIFVTSTTQAGNAKDHTTITGVTSSAEHRGTGVVTNLRSVIAGCTVSSSGNVTAARCVRAEFTNSGTATVAEASAFHSPAPANVGGGTITTWYSLLIEAPTAATFNYAIFCIGGYVIFNVGQDTTSDFVIAGHDVFDALHVQASGSNVGVGTGSEFGSGKGVIGLHNAFTNPSTNPANGGVLYATAGALHWLGSGGTDTPIAPA